MRKVIWQLNIFFDILVCAFFFRSEQATRYMGQQNTIYDRNRENKISFLILRYQCLSR